MRRTGGLTERLASRRSAAVSRYAVVQGKPHRLTQSKRIESHVFSDRTQTGIASKMNSLSLWHWFFIATLVYVGYMVFFRKKKKVETKKTNGMSIGEAEAVINAFGKTLELAGSVPGTVADETKLPYPKYRIKNAILISLKEARSDQDRTFLKEGYLMLSGFQKGVGETDSGVDLTKIDIDEVTNEDLLALASKIGGVDPWQEKVQTELAQLNAELQSAGY